MDTSRSPVVRSSSGRPRALSRPARRVWFTSAFGALGTYVSDTAVKLAAVAALGLSSWQLGVLTAAQSSGFLLVGLFVGVMADRLSRRGLMISAEVARCFVFGLVAIALFLELRDIAAIVLALVLVCSILHAVFEITQQAAIPTYANDAELAATNALIEATRSLMQALGPAMATAIAIMWSPTAGLVIAVASFGLSAIASWRLPRIVTERPAGRPEVFRAIRDGFVLLRRLRDVFSATIAGALFNCAYAMLQTTLLALGAYGAGEAVVGWTLGLAGAAAVAGGLLSRRFANGRQPIRTLAVAELAAFTLVLVAFVGALSGSVVFYAVPFILIHVPTAIFNVTAITLRQRRSPDELLGRMNATVRFLMWGALPIGGVVAGVALAVGGIALTAGAAALLMLGAAAVMTTSWLKHRFTREGNNGRRSISTHRRRDAIE